MSLQFIDTKTLPKRVWKMVAEAIIDNRVKIRDRNWYSDDLRAVGILLCQFYPVGSALYREGHWLRLHCLMPENREFSPREIRQLRGYIAYYRKRYPIMPT